jgi:hypothetical protein
MTLGALGGSVKPLSHAEILALPPAIRLADLAAAFGVSEPVIRRQHRSGELERLGIKVVKLGAQYRVVTSTVWAFLGIGPDGQAGGADSEEPPRIGARQRGPTGSALRAVQPGGGPGGHRGRRR